MIRAFHTSATGMTAQQLVLDNTANNLANANTTAFKRSQVNFEDLVYLNLRRPGTEIVQGQPVPSGLQIGTGVRVSGNSRVFTAGSIQNTGNPLNVAIQGEGFFELLSSDGQTHYYSRDGEFNQNAQGQLVTTDGYMLSPTITIPQNTLTVTIGSDGTVSATAPGTTTPTQVGIISMVRFPNPAGLSAEGNNMFVQTSASGTPVRGTGGLAGFGTMQQGYLEGSNVEVVQEMVNLIQAQRAYEFNTRAVQVADEMLSDTNQLIR